MQTTLLLDSDQIAFSLALRCDSISDAKKSSAQLIESYKFKFRTDDYITFMSCHRTQGFRRRIMPEYKANRDNRPSPPLLDGIRRMLFDEYPCVKTQDGPDLLEADDLMGMGMTRKSSIKSIGISVDKDMLTVPGWSFNPKKDECEIYTDEKTANENFLKQTIAGDGCDGIPGIPGLGKVAAEKLVGSGKVKNLFDVASIYHERGLSFEYFLANARCLKILEDGEYCFTTNKITYRRDKILLNHVTK